MNNLKHSLKDKAELSRSRYLSIKHWKQQHSICPLLFLVPGCGLLKVLNVLWASWQRWSCMQDCSWKTRLWRVSRFSWKQYVPLCVGATSTLSVTQAVPPDCNRKQTAGMGDFTPWAPPELINYFISPVCISSSTRLCICLLIFFFFWHLSVSFSLVMPFLSSVHAQMKLGGIDKAGGGWLAGIAFTFN